MTSTLAQLLNEHEPDHDGALDPGDLRDGGHLLAKTDAVVYRLGLQSAPVLNLPEHLVIGGVGAHFVNGPVVAQATEVRQRPGLPLSFDKRMSRRPVGEGHRLLLLTIETDVVPTDFESALLLWRGRAEAAAGALTAVLDERVAGAQLFEDAVLLAAGSVVSAVDIRERLRHAIPQEVAALDRPALDRLSDLDLGDGSPVARASRLYRRAAAEGPTADAYVMLWVAAEALLDTRQPRKVDLDALLDQAGMDPHGMPLHTGLLIDLRGKIVHEGLEDHERLRVAFYEMEAIIRTLIRRAGELKGGWWPAQDVAGYQAPWEARVADVLASDPPATVWQESFSMYQLPGPERIPRKVAPPDRGLLVSTSERLRAVAPANTVDILEQVVAEGLMYLSPDDGRPVLIDLNDELGIHVNMESILIHESVLEGCDDPSRPEKIVNLVWSVHGSVGSVLASREIDSSDDGVALVEAIGAWFQYQRLINEGEFDPTLLRLPDASGGDMLAIGKLSGWAAAGDVRARDAVSRLAGRTAEVATSITEMLKSSRPGPPRPAVLLEVPSQRAGS